VNVYAKNETLYALTCSNCKIQIVRKKVAYLEKLANKDGWQIGTNKVPTLCADCKLKAKRDI
jgi:hypothetical protein